MGELESCNASAQLELVSAVTSLARFGGVSPELPDGTKTVRHNGSAQLMGRFCSDGLRPAFGER